MIGTLGRGLLDFHRQQMGKLPLLALKPLANMPAIVHQSILAHLLQPLLVEVVKAGDADCLRGRWLQVLVSDLQLSWSFTLGENDKIVVSSVQQFDVCIRGEVQSFVSLAAGNVDPDTLFFQRRLTILGDTELGLEIKNLLDRIAPDQLAPELRFLLRSLSEYQQAFPH